MGTIRVSKRILWGDSGQDEVDEGLERKYHYNYEKPGSRASRIDIYKRAIKDKILFEMFSSGYGRDSHGHYPSQNEYKYHLRVALGLDAGPLYKKR
jgi:hypothetical protein